MRATDRPAVATKPGDAVRRVLFDPEEEMTCTIP
jgi:hypothetical protein